MSEVSTEATRTLQTVMNEKGTPSLKAIALVHNLDPVRIYSVAKQPKVGEVYDAKQYNWDAIERFIARRFAPTAFMSFDAVIDAALLVDEELKQTDGRRTAPRAGARMLEVDGKTIPARKYPSFEIESGMPVCLKDDINVYKIVYQTISHTVLVPVSIEGDLGNAVEVKSNGMLNFKGVAPAMLDEAVTANYAAQAAQPAAEVTPE